MSLEGLPAKLPVPQDDGACDHLIGMSLPELLLRATDGSLVNLAALSGRTVLYIYPMTGTPGTDLPNGWDETPGARGCTPQSCAFRDHKAELDALDARVYGVSAQPTLQQQEAAERLHLPYLLLSDPAFKLATALKLPTFTLNGQQFFKRVTLITHGALIEHIFYPVFPPDRNAAEVVAYLKAHP